MASSLDVTALLLYYRSRMEHDLHAHTLLFDIATQCNVVCTNNGHLHTAPPTVRHTNASHDPLTLSLYLLTAASEATLDSLLPPFSPLSLSTLSDCLPDPSSAPVRSARGRQCLDVCITRYLDVSGYTTRRMGRTVTEIVKADRLRDRRRQKEREREGAAVSRGSDPTQVDVSNRQAAEGVG
jgi:hypothetical protein